MNHKYSHQLRTAISFSLTAGVISALGMIVGLNSATSSRLAVIAAIVILAISDGLADAAGMHMAEETEIEEGKAKHTTKEVWMTTIVTFLSGSVIVLTFVIPILIFPLRTAVAFAIGWGMLLIILLNIYVARIKKESTIKLITEHLLVALFVIIISNWLGNMIAIWLG